MTGLLTMLCAGAAASSAQANTQCKPAQVVRGADLNPSDDGTLAWSSAASNGLGFAVIKATQGDSYSDNDFAENWAALKSAGVVRGAYHFFDATVDGATQANFFLSVMGTLEPGDMPPSLDIECPVSGEDDCLGNGSSGYAPSSEITSRMNDFLTTVEAATGRIPIVYSYGSWFSDNGVDTSGLDRYPLWLADYSGTDCFTVPSPWSAATLWQYDSSGSVGSINVDDDDFLGSASALRAFIAASAGDAGDGVDAGDGADAGAPCVVSFTGESGVCLDTSACAAMPGYMSTAGFCPGPDNIECCTPPTDFDAGGHSETSPDAGEAASTGVGESTQGSTASTGVGHSNSSTGGGVKVPGRPKDAGVHAGDAAHESNEEDGGSSGGCAVAKSEPAAAGLPAMLMALAGLMTTGRRKRR